MEGKETPKEFPDVSQKLSAPKKLSAFEKERQAAQAKQQRAEAENAAALKAFENSFAGDDDDDGFHTSYGGRGPPSGPRGPGMGYGSGGRYGAPPPGPRGGPGSFGPPPPSLKRKRALDEMREAQEARREQEEMLAYEGPGDDARDSPGLNARAEQDDVDAPRPTIQLSSLPPDTTADGIKSLLKDQLKVHSVRFLPPSAPGTETKRTLSAIATLSSDISSSQIDLAIGALKQKYLGRGFYLSVSRHLSSAAFHPTVISSNAASSNEPFGAERPRETRDQHSSMRNAPPPMEHRGFAPPDSYDAPSRSRQRGPDRVDAVVAVRPPADIEAVNAIHTVVDRLLLEPDPARALQIEASLMSLPEVQLDERFAFLYDSQSTAGAYYRFLLWAPDEPSDVARDDKRQNLTIERIHDDVPIEWHPPYAQVQFPDLKSLEQVVTEIDYISSDEESDDGEGGERQFNASREGDGLSEANERKHLTPLQRARFVYLLSRLPTSNARLRKGDVARITSFAIGRAGAGAEEIVDMLLLNVVKPFSYTLASRYEDSDSQDEEDVYEPNDDLSALDSPAPQPQKDSKRDDDPSNAKLIALYVISDILSASSTAGARNAWKYRQLFESGFKAQNTFDYLGKLDKELAWGRMKSEQWKRKVGVVFGIWEGWSVFSNDVHKEFKQSFFEPPLSEEEKAAAAAEAEREENRKQEEKFMGKFKRVESVGSPAASASPAPAPAPVPVVAEKVDQDVEGAPLDGAPLDGAPLEEVDGAPLAVVVDGDPMEDIDGQNMADAGSAPGLGGMDGAADQKPADSAPANDHSSAPASTSRPAKPSGPKKRMRAADMFGDSSDED
ncbi:uncharacterized protein LTR77_005818 [Saxophila tyrrhenica]|uniref:CID domain-containing protein n=1 Tax=Saxophila tyrrhenica TaxID=1690608 RepID=A0AAV9PDT2_9PEZI|nr:hypothetical protein LTR77_005818 [Saxophila tyrrhenica]